MSGASGLQGAEPGIPPDALPLKPLAADTARQFGS